MFFKQAARANIPAAHILLEAAHSNVVNHQGNVPAAWNELEIYSTVALRYSNHDFSSAQTSPAMMYAVVRCTDGAALAEQRLWLNSLQRSLIQSSQCQRRDLMSLHHIHRKLLLLH